jgi:hypothetical protein
MQEIAAQMQCENEIRKIPWADSRSKANAARSRRLYDTDSLLTCDWIKQGQLTLNSYRMKARHITILNLVKSLSNERRQWRSHQVPFEHTALLSPYYEIYFS